MNHSSSSRQHKSPPPAAANNTNNTSAAHTTLSPPNPNETVTCVVMDTGTASIKAGLGGEDAPRTQLPTRIGWPRHPGVTGQMLSSTKDCFIGSCKEEGLLSMHYPMTKGLVTDWLVMERLWHQMFFTDMRICPEEHPMLITEAAHNPRADRQKAAEIMFEVFNVPALYVSNQSVLALYSVGKCTGTVVDSGDGCTNVVPVWEGYSLPHYVKPLPISGQEITTHLFNTLRKDGGDFSTLNDRRLLEQMKSSLLYISRDPRAEYEYSQQSVSLEKTYDLPDGTQVVLNETRFMCPEVMFNPSLLEGVELNETTAGGIHKVVHASISMCQTDTQKDMYSNIVLAGGNTLFPKFDERLQKELSSLTSNIVKVTAFPERQYASWIGGSIVASMQTFPSMWVNKSEYDDYGSAIIHRKCIS